ncbi:hypothetical protein APR41_05475 [Salegentibacter salinarum]|uniref:Uncharacterized protein n=1 Tax=Salegentibacter salinarum TaxID=447422 RepID=A0A2N0TSE5_9FLAO|nr:hypothetical protein [Salegentibacter salinarum]PKD17659.1 hypothetical protein APR41_05475 [Salegentibacter salinarum]SKB50550.1 hypothetical protein SAMN05660903_01121 [Salegentibacter salinarum]
MILDLTELELGKHHNLTPAMGVSLSHAAAVCINDRGHALNVSSIGKGAYTRNYTLKRCEVTNEISRTWNDMQEATEEGACGVALVQVAKESKYQVIERSKKGTGIDYWLGDKDGFLFQRKARLEVSGSLNGDEKELNKRLQTKIEQTKQSDATKLPAIIVIVGFSHPMILTAER